MKSPRAHRSSRRHHRGRPPRRWQRRGLRDAAQSRLKAFRQASALAVALTAMLLVFWQTPATLGQSGAGPESPASAEAAPGAEAQPPGPTQAEVDAEPPGDAEPAGDGEPSGETRLATVEAERSLDEATSTVRDLLQGSLALLPKVVVALLLIVLALLLSRLVRHVLHRFSHRWEKMDAVSALVRIGLVLLAIGAGLSVIAGDARALVGSVGLVGLALSWALQTPIESFTGWVLNAFRSYYRPGDRIEVGEVYGDVYRIDVLTTTVWQVGGPGKPVGAAQSTGALVTFPNWEVLRSNIINYSRDFPFVWDEVTVGITNESDVRYAVALLQRVATETLGESMRAPAERYRGILQRERLDFDVAPQPEVYVSLTDAWTNCTIRYLIPVRERRKWSSRILLALSEELSKPEHAGRVEGSYPRTVVDLRNEPSGPEA